MKAKLQMQQRKIDQERAKLALKHQRHFFPGITWEQVKSRVQNGEQLVVIENNVYDVKTFVHEHPGSTILL